MTEQPEDAADAIAELGALFSPGYVGHVVSAEAHRLITEINYRLVQLNKYLSYLAGTYYTDQQRGQAEIEIFRIQTELDTLNEQLRNTLVMAPELGRPVTVTYT